jgi:hypothetical protein
MIAAVAFDDDGNPSPVYRSVHTFTREGAGDAQEFVDYYMGTITTSTLSLDKTERCELESLVIASDVVGYKTTSDVDAVNGLYRFVR